MCLTGHRQVEIVRAIKEAATVDRPGEKRDWDAYAKRTQHDPKMGPTVLDPKMGTG
jgi:hypothetical protein